VTTPTAAYTNALLWFLGDGTAPKLAFDAALGAPVPFYLTGWAIHVVLGLWLAVPLSLGYRWFATEAL
jgi:ABC-2 type transport system permease protein